MKRCVATGVSISTLIMVLAFVPNVTHAAESVSLDQFLSDAKAHNLSLKASLASSEAEREGAYGIKLPPPQVNYLNMAMPGGSGSGFEVNQVIPFPTKITSEHGARKSVASARKQAFNAREAEVVAAARYLYFRLWEAGERVHLLGEKARIIKHHIKLGQAVSRSDSFLKTHVIKAENDLDLVENSVVQAQQELRERQIEAAEFLNRDPSAYQPTALDIQPSAIPSENALRAPSQLESKKFELEFLKYKEASSKSDWLPDFNLKYKDMGRTPALPHYTQITVGVTLPFVFFWEPRAESGKATAKRFEGELLLEKERRRIEAEKITFMERAVSLKKQLDRFMEDLLPRAEKRVKIVNNLAPRDMETLRDHRETLEAFPDLKLKALDVREQYERSIMELRKFQSGPKS